MEHLRLTVPTLRLPEWQARDVAAWAKRADLVKEVARCVGVNSDRFKLTLATIRRIGIEQDGRGIDKEIIGRLHARVLAYLWAQDDTFAKHVRVTPALLDAMREASGGVLGRLTLFLLIRAFFVRFQTLADGNDLMVWGERLQDHLASVRGKVSSDIQKLAASPRPLFSVNGPHWLAAKALNEGTNFEVLAQRFGLGAYGGGEFLRCTRLAYYVGALSSIPVGEAHPVLAEVVEKDVYDARVGNARLVGHEALTILIDRSPESGVAEAWQNVILTIAGDPRVPKGSARYQKWWAILGQARVDKVRRWLSRFDLLLFLNVLERYGQESGDAELQRMFPARKRFLEGIYEQGKIKETRLFVNPRAALYLKHHYRKEHLPEFAVLKDAYRSVIYMRVDDQHMIEGSHSFKLWIFPRLPAAGRVLDYSKNTFSPAELSSTVQAKYYQEFGDSAQAPADIVHSPWHFIWQHKAIEYFRGQGVSLQIWKLFEQEDYRRYKKRYGA